MNEARARMGRKLSSFFMEISFGRYVNPEYQAFVFMESREPSRENSTSFSRMIG